MISWSTQPLPSGSLNDACAKYERPSGARGPGAADLHLADVDAAADEIVTGGVDVGRPRGSVPEPTPAQPSCGPCRTGSSTASGAA